MNDAFDFGLAELVPADDASADAAESFWSGDLTALSHHHTMPNGSHSFVVAHDRSVTWGTPGAPQVMAIAVARDLGRSTFTLETSYHATVPFAQNWLVEHGCPPAKIAQIAKGFVTPADDLTLQIEQQIRESGTRYEVVDSYSTDFDPCETWTLTRDSQASQVPVRLFHEEWDHDAGTYTMREGAFADVSAARSWLDDRDGPLPEPPEYHHASGAVLRARTRAALARSAGTSAMPKTDAPLTPAAAPVQRPVQWRRR
ncbi:glycosyl hydrolase [Streptomyces sp. NPDC059913]|uniref:glycosyl hydrolase n=1 Tax=unclassified Streptomyces TaxID=2593676 RepID=UPI003657CFC7